MNRLTKTNKNECGRWMLDLQMPSDIHDEIFRILKSIVNYKDENLYESAEKVLDWWKDEYGEEVNDKKESVVEFDSSFKFDEKKIINVEVKQ